MDYDSEEIDFFSVGFGSRKVNEAEEGVVLRVEVEIESYREVNRNLNATEIAGIEQKLRVHLVQRSRKRHTNSRILQVANTPPWLDTVIVLQW
jgi:hypothetical protein